MTFSRYLLINSAVTINCILITRGFIKTRVFKNSKVLLHGNMLLKIQVNCHKENRESSTFCSYRFVSHILSFSGLNKTGDF